MKSRSQYHAQSILLRAEIWRGKDPYDQRDGGDPRERNVIRQVHGNGRRGLSAALIILGFRSQRKLVFVYFLPLTISRQRVYSSSSWVA